MFYGDDSDIRMSYVDLHFGGTAYGPNLYSALRSLVSDELVNNKGDYCYQLGYP